MDRARTTLSVPNNWAAEKGLTFSVNKSQAMQLNGGLEPFGNESTISVGSVRYLSVELDSRRDFWAHLKSVAEKSRNLYSRLRATTSAVWGYPAGHFTRNLSRGFCRGTDQKSGQTSRQSPKEAAPLNDGGIQKHLYICLAERH